jgi:RsiW-degrading membrane proteinase PrsW (M82 family)
MTAITTFQSLLGVAPVCVFLGSLVYIDSYKLVRISRILQLILAGGVAAVVSYVIHRQLLDGAVLDRQTLARLGAPAVEEVLKLLPILFLLRGKRIGFVIDAAICGFAAGAGFAVVENLYYLSATSGRGIPFWIVRGFGTAVMHGGATAIAAMITKMLWQRRESRSWLLALPGLMVAFSIHSLFNHFLLTPLASAVAVMIILPPLLVVVFAFSERQLQSWLGSGFDLDSDLIKAIRSGDFVSSRPGRYLQSLREHFQGPVVADMLCYLRLYSELSMRAKGILMLRESGLPIPKDVETARKMAELRYLRAAIGPTGQLALAPLLHRSEQDLWQMDLLTE